MNLSALANSATSAVSPNTAAVLLRSIGYTTGTGMKQAPSYASAVPIMIAVQALDGDDLKQIDGLNIQGTLRAVYVPTAIKGASRPDGTGGDVLQFNGGEWLVVKALESWPWWTKAVVVLQ